jgi:hypothetical protein
MTVYYVIGGAIACYLVLVARSAWKQGELKQFLRSLGIVAALIGLVVAGVEGWVWMTT